LVLDVGCAEGYVTKYVAEVSDVIVGVDITYLKLAKQKIPGASLINDSFEYLPLREKLFDSIVLLEVLEHLLRATQVKGLFETVRVLKKDGSLFISVPYKEPITYISCTYCIEIRMSQRLSFSFIAIETNFALSVALV